MEDHLFSWVVSGVAFWTATFFLTRRIFSGKSFGFSNRIVSAIHASAAVCLASFTVQDWRCPVCPLASRSSLLQMQTLAATLSYLIYDLICCHFDEKVGLDNLVHHIICIGGIVPSLVYERSGSEIVAALWVTEISSPFLHMREILKELGFKDTDLNLAVDIVFAIIFSFARMVCGPYITYVTVTSGNPLLIKAMAMSLQLVSVFWFYKILRMVRHKLTKKVTADKTGSASFQRSKIL